MKLIILDQLMELKVAHREIMVDMVMDVFQALWSPNVNIPMLFRLLMCCSLRCGLFVSTHFPCRKLRAV